MRIHEAIHLLKTGKAKYLHLATAPTDLYIYDAESKCFTRYYKFENGCMTMVSFKIPDLRVATFPFQDSIHWCVTDENLKGIPQ